MSRESYDRLLERCCDIALSLCASLKKNWMILEPVLGRFVVAYWNLPNRLLNLRIHACWKVAPRLFETSWCPRNLRLQEAHFDDISSGGQALRRLFKTCSGRTWVFCDLLLPSSPKENIRSERCSWTAYHNLIWFVPPDLRLAAAFSL